MSFTILSSPRVQTVVSGLPFESFVRLVVLNVSDVQLARQPRGTCLDHQTQLNAKVAANFIAARFEEILQRKHKS